MLVVHNREGVGVAHEITQKPASIFSDKDGSR